MLCLLAARLALGALAAVITLAVGATEPEHIADGDFAVGRGPTKFVPLGAEELRPPKDAVDLIRVRARVEDDHPDERRITPAVVAPILGQVAAVEEFSEFVAVVRSPGEADHVVIA